MPHSGKRELPLEGFAASWKSLIRGIFRPPYFGRKGTFFASKVNFVLTWSPLLLTLSAQALWEAFVSKLVTAVLIATMSLVMIEAPVLAAPAGSPSAPLGVVVAAENANVGAGVTSSGATIYDGDHLQTPANSTLRVRFGSGQMVLRQNTTADVHSFPNGFSADLNSGTVVVSSAEGQTFQLIADGATIRPADSQATSGQISMISPTELILTGTRGTMRVTMGDEVKTVEAGSSYRMEVETEDPGPNPQAPHPTARNHFLWIVIPVIAAVTGIVIWRALVSPDAPK
jgi:hypothetical protein